MGLHAVDPLVKVRLHVTAKNGREALHHGRGIGCVVPGNRTGIAPEWGFDDSVDAPVGDARRPGVRTNLIRADDLFGRDDDLPGSERRRNVGYARPEYARITVLVRLLHVDDSDVGIERGDDDGRLARIRVTDQLRARVLKAVGAAERTDGDEGDALRPGFEAHRHHHVAVLVELRASPPPAPS